MLLRASAGAVLEAEQSCAVGAARASAALGRKFLYTVCRDRVARKSTPLVACIWCHFYFRTNRTSKHLYRSKSPTSKTHVPCYQPRVRGLVPRVHFDRLRRPVLFTKPLFSLLMLNYGLVLPTQVNHSSYTFPCPLPALAILIALEALYFALNDSLASLAILLIKPCKQLS